MENVISVRFLPQKRIVERKKYSVRHTRGNRGWLDDDIRLRRGIKKDG